MFMARAKRVTEMVQPVIIPFSSLCHSDVMDPEDSHLEIVVVIKDEVVDFIGDMVCMKSHISTGWKLFLAAR